jgi:hypothetical protein
MNTYLAYYNRKTVTIHAETSYEAQKKAAFYFKAKKAYKIGVMLVMNADGEVTHDTASL